MNRNRNIQRRAHHGSRGTAVARIAGVTLAAAALLVTVTTLIAQPAMPSAPAWTSVSVGDDVTLWGLAASHPVEGLGTSATVELIRERNGISGSTLFVGQTVLVPAIDAGADRIASR